MTSDTSAPAPLHPPRSRRPRLPRSLVAALLLLATATLPAGAQSAGGSEVTDLAAALEASKRDHLWRIAVWGGANVALGVGLLASGSRETTPGRFGYGVQSAAWGAINLGIVGVSLLGGETELPTTLSGAIAAERGWSDVLLLNLGLNVGYMGVGTALAVAAGRGLGRADEVRGHAWGVIVQGAGLFLLDGIAWMASRGRMDALVELVSATEVALVPTANWLPHTGQMVRGIGLVVGVPVG